MFVVCLLVCFVVSCGYVISMLSLFFLLLFLLARLLACLLVHAGVQACMLGGLGGVRGWGRGGL